LINSSLESKEWKRQLPHYLGVAPAGPSFYANVFHPDFNFDAEEATETVNRFDVHTKAVDAGVQGLRNVFSQVRQARVGEQPRIVSVVRPHPIPT
jgi:sorting nexin-9/18/33